MVDNLSSFARVSIIHPVYYLGTKENKNTKAFASSTFANLHCSLIAAKWRHKSSFIEPGHQWSRSWFDTFVVPSPCLNQWWFIAN